MDATRALKDAENALRDFIAQILERSLGKDWVSQCGVTENRIAKWQERKQTESKRQEAGVTEERLLYYADFFDIITILKKHWQHFSEALGDWKTMEVWLSELAKLRDPDAHRRELLPHQHNLAIGIAGEIRTRISRYRSSLETGESYFPRIESARDSLGTIYVAGQITLVRTGHILRPGDSLDFVITASDPFEAALKYNFSFAARAPWQDHNFGSVTIDNSNIGAKQNFFLKIKSPREFHAYDDYDDMVIFLYDILPPKR